MPQQRRPLVPCSNSQGVKHGHAHGFTLVELLVSVAILGIMLSLALPAMGDFLQRTKIERFGSELRAGVSYARQQALRSGQRTVLCMRVAGQNACSSNRAGPWQSGWLVFHDTAPNFLAPPSTDNNNQFDAGAGETLLKVVDVNDSFWASSSGPDMNTVNPYISFSGQGIPLIASDFCVRICAEQSCASHANNRYLIVTTAGHTRMETEDTIGQAANSGICS